MSKVLVLGSDGQVGKELKKCAPNNFIFLSKKEIDINNHNKVRKIIIKKKPKIIINLAAYTNVDESEINKLDCLNTNYLSIINLINFIKEKNILFFYISTDYVFDGKKKNKYKEYNKKNPINFYGLTKSLSEDYIIDHSDNYLILRTSWIYSDNKSSFLYKVLKLIKNNKNVYGVIDNYSGPTSAFNLSKAIIFIIKKKIRNKILHFNDNKKLSPYQFISIIKKKFPKSTSILKKIKYRETKLNANRPKNSFLSISKVLKKIKTASLIKEIVKYEKNIY